MPAPVFSFVYVTIGDLDQARAIGRTVVEERLAACANIIPGMQSVYRWKGKICEDRECVLILKTRTARCPALTTRLRELHPYECPCIIQLPIRGGYQPFLDWLDAETRPAKA